MLATTNKSVLDNVPVDDKEWAVGELPSCLDIVGHCPRCGAPIYGRNMIGEMQTPFIRYSCSCRRSVGMEHRTK